MARELRIYAATELGVLARIIVIATGVTVAEVVLEESVITGGYYTGNWPAIAVGTYDLVLINIVSGAVMGSATVVWNGATLTDVDSQAVRNALALGLTPGTTVAQGSIDGQLAALAESGGGTGGAGDGDIAVNHDTGGTDALRAEVGGIGVDACIIRAYLKADYDAGTRHILAQSTTGTDGRWIQDMMLDAGVYILTFSAPGYILGDEEVTVAS
jgi:hypothetical protein